MSVNTFPQEDVQRKQNFIDGCNKSTVPFLLHVYACYLLLFFTLRSYAVMNSIVGEFIKCYPLKYCVQFI